MSNVYSDTAGQPQLPPPPSDDPFGTAPGMMPGANMSNAFGGARRGEGSGAFGGGGMGGMAGGNQAPFGMIQPGGQAAWSAMADQSGQQAGGQQAGGLPGYLVSLDTQLPVRGDEYLFTTPRGATEITAQSISTDTLERWSTVAALIVLGLIAWE